MTHPTSQLDPRVLRSKIANNQQLEFQLRQRLLETSFTVFGFENVTLGVPALIGGEEINLVRLDFGDHSSCVWAVDSVGWELGEAPDAWGHTAIFEIEAHARANFESERQRLEEYATHGAPLNWWAFPLTREQLGEAFQRAGAPAEAVTFNLDELDAFQSTEFGPVELELNIPNGPGTTDLFLICQELGDGSRQYGIRGHR
jgi:hypothetical protein